MRPLNVTIALLLSFIGCHLSNASYLQLSRTSKDAERGLLSDSYLDSQAGHSQFEPHTEFAQQLKLETLWGSLESSARGANSKRTWLIQHGRQKTDTSLLERYPELKQLHDAMQEQQSSPSVVSTAQWQACLVSAFNSLSPDKSWDHEKELKAALLLELLAKHSEVDQTAFRNLSSLGRIFSTQAILSVRQLKKKLGETDSNSLAAFFQELDNILTARDPYPA